MRILGFYDSSGPKYHRVLTPAFGLEDQFGAEFKAINYIPKDPGSLFDGVDIFLFNRAVPIWNREELLHWRDKWGFKMVCDLDDHWLLDKGHPLYHGYQVQGISNIIEWFIKNSDLITCTHDRLRDEVLPLNKNCHVIPNAIPKVAQFLAKRIPDPEGDTRLFWAGGVTHKRDLEQLREPLKKIKRQKVKFVMGGFEEGHPDWIEMAKIFTTDSTYKTIVMKGEPPSNYYRLYQLCDISLIPLIDVSFNIFKSNLKILEAGNIEAPVVVSKVHPYLDWPDHLVNYVDLHRPWYKQIMKLINDPVLRKEQAAELKNYCDIHYNFNKFTVLRNQIFDDLIKR